MKNENQKASEFTYEEWHLLWKATEARATHYWAYVERFQIASKENPDSDTDLWVHFLGLAEEQTALLDKIELIANQHFPIVKDELPVYTGPNITGEIPALDRMIDG